MVSLPGGRFSVLDGSKVAREEAAHGGVVGVDVWTEEFGQHAWFLVGRGGGETLFGFGGEGAIASAGGAIDAGFLERGAARSGLHGTFFDTEEAFLFGFEGAGEVVKEWG